MRLPNLLSALIAPAPIDVPAQRSVSPAPAFQIRIAAQPRDAHAHARVVASSLGVAADHDVDSWEDVARIARAHGVRLDDVTWTRGARAWAQENWELPPF